jgi:hypothetical protein
MIEKIPPKDVSQELINKVKSKCCGIKGDNINGKIQQLET